MIFKFDSNSDEDLARGGTFDITGTGAVIDKQFFGFIPSEGAVLAVIKGVPVRSSLSTLTAIRAAEVDLASFFLTALTDPLTADFYRVDGYIITNVQFTSGTGHFFKTLNQVTAE
jgi:hypothetical protein